MLIVFSKASQCLYAKEMELRVELSDDLRLQNSCQTKPRIMKGFWLDLGTKCDEKSLI